MDGTGNTLRGALAYRLTFRCYQGLPLLSSDRTKHWFLNALRRARDRHDFLLRAYVLMPEHAHVLLVPRDPKALDEICRSIKIPVARRARAFLTANHPDRLERLKVTRPSGRVEFRLWENQCVEDRAVVMPAAATSVIEHMHQNPVRRGIVHTATEWTWSSARWSAGIGEVPLRMDGGSPHASGHH